MNHLVESTIFAFAAALAALSLRSHRAHDRFWVWMAASLKFLVPFSLLVAFGKLAGAHLGFSRSIAPPQPLMLSVPTVEPSISADPAPLLSAAAVSPISFEQILLAIWICGAAAVLFAWLLKWRRIHRVVGESSLAGFTFPVEVRFTSERVEPAIVGIFRPVLLLPEGIEERLTPDHLRTIFAHELCHLRRRDNLLAALHMMVEATFWFHPLVWWIGARLLDERERACDEEVLRLGNPPEAYAEGILRVCEFCLEAPLACVAGVTGADLKKRIEQIVDHRAAGVLDLPKKFLLAASASAAVLAPIFFGCLNAPPSRAHTPAAAFDAASVKQNKSGTRGSSFPPLAKGRISAVNVTLRDLIAEAYHAEFFQISGGPSWLNSQRFDIEGRAEGNPSAAQLREMLKNLLADRFKLTIRTEVRDLPIYELTIARRGMKMPQAQGECPAQVTPSAPCGGFRVYQRRQISGDRVSMEQLTDILTTMLGRRVNDRTGLAGFYNVKLEWTPDPGQFPGAPGERDPLPPSESGPSIFTAVEEQLGLKLESAKGPVPMLAIERAGMPSEN